MMDAVWLRNAPQFFPAFRRRFVAIVAALAVVTLFVAGCATRTSGQLVASVVQHPPAPKLRLASPFGDHIVVQRNFPVRVWGWAVPGATVQVEFRGKTETAAADSTGTWALTLPTGEAGGPFDLTVHSGQDSITLRDVLVGEVWLCSGQSNMEMPVAGWGRILNYKEELAAAKYPKIRFLNIPHQIAMAPQLIAKKDGWTSCTPETVANFSAVAYFFGRELHQKLGVPVGVIQSTWGGTPVEVWTSLDALEAVTFMNSRLEALNPREITTLEQARERFLDQQKSWFDLLDNRDPGRPSPATAAWAEPDFDDSAWITMDVPGPWEKSGLPNFDGIVWFRRELTIPPEWAGRPLRLDLGPVDDQDWTYFNGRRIGSTSESGAFRKYDIPSELVKPGRAVVAVRVLDTVGDGGVVGKPRDVVLRLTAGDSATTLPLAGSWRFHAALNLRDLPPAPSDPASRYPRWPACLYDAMIAPLIPYTIAGVLWYQGESNAARAFEYRTLFPAMIQDWRQRWGQGLFPFLFVQLANFKQVAREPQDSEWAELREAQTFALSLPNNAMAVAIDIGDAADIHPKNKQEIAHRLALAALARVYGEKIEYSGPAYRSGSMRVHKSEARLTFDHAQGGLVAKGDDGKLLGFTIAGDDRGFAPAEARIDDNTVIVRSDSVQRPVAVRYAWADNPTCNLYNAAGLPAPPFRTDEWPGITGKP